ncbi:STAS-like domain-containing protein [Sulfurihydrogenibium yellowstonense]|nr:STAS-like domain-containing protein [Sulfurihydrogenibium yellowstonense]
MNYDIFLGEIMESRVDVAKKEIKNNETQDEIVVKLKELFPDCSSLTLRETGFEVREIMNEILSKYNRKVVLDFDGIEIITQGFGDEIVGVFVRKNGLDFVKNKIKVVNANNFIRGTLNWVVSYSKKMAQNNSSS